MIVSRIGCAAACLFTVGIWASSARGEDKPAGQQKSESKADDKGRGCTPKEKDPQRHEQFMRRKESLNKHHGTQLVFIGDSITDGWRGGEQRDIFDDAFGRYNPYNIGISGDETQHVLWRIEHGELDGISPKAVVIMIGTNNLGNTKQTPQETIDGIKCVVEAVEKKLPEAKILLLGVFPRGHLATDPYRGQIKEVNDAVSKLVDGDKHVKYLDIADKFLDKEGNLPKEIMPDYLHPNVKGYEIWADAIAPAVDEMEK